jgi:hypothetical protein
MSTVLVRWIRLYWHLLHTAIAGCAKGSGRQQILPELGIVKNATSQKARRVLGCSPQSREEALIATAESLIRYELLKDSGKGK